MHVYTIIAFPSGDLIRYRVVKWVVREGSRLVWIGEEIVAERLTTQEEASAVLARLHGDKKMVPFTDRQLGSGCQLTLEDIATLQPFVTGEERSLLAAERLLISHD